MVIERKKNTIKRLFYIIFLLIILSIGSLSILAFMVRQKQNKVFESTNQIALNKSIREYIDIKQLQLKQILEDYSFWDEMVHFVRFKDIKWAENNIDPSSKTYKLDAIWVYDTTFQKIYPNSNKKNNLLNHRIISRKELEALKEKKFISYFSYSGDSLLEIFGNTIHPSGDPLRRTKPEGFIYFARIWDKDYLNEFADITSTNLVIIRGNQPIPVENKNIIQSVLPILDQHNHVIANLVAFKSNNALSLFDKFSHNFGIGLVIMAILMISLYFYTANRFWKKPITIITETLKNDDISKIGQLKEAGPEFENIGNLIRNHFHQTEELKLAKEKAEESEKLKSAFLANMSHEIRSPLNGIMGFSDLLMENISDQERVKQFANYINSRSKDLLRIINDILDFSRIEAQQLEIIPSPFKMSSLIEELSMWYELDNQYANKPVKLKFRDGQDALLYTDYLRLKQILVNLIDNALKFTNQGSVEIDHVIREGELIISIEDTGIGIPDHQLEIIFDRFRQNSDLPSAMIKGNGLGLAICKGLADLMHGKIWVESQVNTGSIFYISFPVQASGNE